MPITPKTGSLFHADSHFRGHFAKLLSEYAERAPDGGSARIAKTFALTAVAGSLACKWKVLPFNDQSVVRSILQLHQSIPPNGEAQGTQSAFGRIQEYIQRYEDDLSDVPPTPSAPADFAESFGFRWTKGGREAVLIPSERFQSAFPDYRGLMRELRAAGYAKTEPGKQPKLTVKCPTAICATGRVYWIFLSPDQNGAG